MAQLPSEVSRQFRVNILQHLLAVVEQGCIRSEGKPDG
jgi:hypothetical protein